MFFVGNQNQLFGGDTKLPPGDSDWLGVSGNNNALAGGFGHDWLGATGNGNTLAGEAGSDSLFAVGGANALFGGIDNDWLGVSGSGNRLDGGAGDDWLGATGSGNTFVFHPGARHDQITGFVAGDLIDLQGYGLTFGSLQQYMAQIGGDTVIDFKNGDILTLHTVQKSGLQAGDFLLV